MIDEIIIVLIGAPIALFFIVLAFSAIRGDFLDFIDRKKAQKEEYKELARLNEIKEELDERSKQIAKKEEEIAQKEADIALEQKGIEKTREDFSQEWKRIQAERRELQKEREELEQLRQSFFYNPQNNSNNEQVEKLKSEIKSKDKSIQELSRKLSEAISKNKEATEHMFDMQVAEDDLLHERDSYFIKKIEAEEVIKKYNEAYDNVKRDVLRSLSEPLRLDPEREAQFVNEFFTEKGRKAVTEKMDISNFKIECTVFSRKSGTPYQTSLSKCSCKNCEVNIGDHPNYICKHMIALAIHLNAFKVDPFVMTETQAICAQREKEFIGRANSAEKEYNAIEKKIKQHKEEMKKYDKWKDDVRVDFPWISEILVWIEEKYGKLLLQELPANAHKSEEIVKAIKKENKELAARVGELEARLATYGHFRLERFRNMPLAELKSIAEKRDIT